MLPPKAQEALKEVQRLNASLGMARRRYHDALQEDNLVSGTAFRIFQLIVQSTPDWDDDEPVTWEHWWELQAQEERDEWLALAADIIEGVKAELE